MSSVGPIILGFLISLLGFSNLKGNISSVHWYHRMRVTEENKLPFGRLIGLGTIVIGISIIIFGCLFFVAQRTQVELYMIIGAGIVVAGIIMGVGMALYAMIKYNKGIF